MIGETKEAHSTLSPALSRGLGEQINAASRSAHFLLNRLIVNRLPLALPPYATDPSIYMLGLLRIAPLYTTFESIWESLLDTKMFPVIPCIDRDCDVWKHRCSSNLPVANDPSPTRHIQTCPRLRSLLGHLHLPGLVRSMRLRADIRSACRISETELDEQFRQISESGEIAHVCEPVYICMLLSTTRSSSSFKTCGRQCDILVTHGY